MSTNVSKPQAPTDYRMLDRGRRVVVVSELDHHDMEALVGEEDEDGVVWDRVWVPWSDLSPIPKKPV